MSRRDQVLDAAITVLARHGLRQLTHRAVDRAAGLPAGSTSNICRTRDQLISMTLERVAERELALWGELTASGAITTTDELAANLALVIETLAHEHRELIVARRALTADTGAAAAAPPALRSGRAMVAAWAITQLEAVGSPDPRHDHLVLLAMLDGLIDHLLTTEGPRLNPGRALTAVLRGLSST